MANQIYEALMKKMQDVPVIDTHEHIPGSNAKRVRQHDFFCEYLPGYLNRDLRNAGLSTKDYNYLLESGHTIMEKWNKVSKYWNYSRHTGYVQMFDEAVRALYGLDGINENTVEAVNEALMKTHETDHYKTVLHDKCHIKTILANNRDPESDKNYITYVPQINFMAYPVIGEQIELLEGYVGHPIFCLDDWLEACTVALHKEQEAGAVCFKMWIAYMRDIHFTRPTYNEAEKAFNEMMAAVKRVPIENPQPVRADRAFTDYAMHHVLHELNKMDTVLQIHTGYLDGIGGYLEDTDPALLNNVFMEYPNLRFVMFHMGFPYQEKAIALCKMFPNVYLDFCWTHVLAPESTRETLKKCITTLPVNKFTVFGGDHNLAIDAIYGHLIMAKRNVAEVLTECIEKNIIDLDRAYWIIDRIFYENAVDLYQLKLN